MQFKQVGRPGRWQVVGAAAAVLLSGCAGFGGPLPAGTPIAEARSAWGRPTGEYDLPGGGRRLEYAHGAFGKVTYMLDFDGAGRLVATDQVLTEAHFADIAPGMPRDEVRLRLGRPAWIFNVGRQHLQVWNYRYFEGDCVWFQISISDDSGAVTEASHGTDPACDGPKGSRE